MLPNQARILPNSPDWSSHTQQYRIPSHSPRPHSAYVGMYVMFKCHHHPLIPHPEVRGKVGKLPHKHTSRPQGICSNVPPTLSHESPTLIRSGKVPQAPPFLSKFSHSHSRPRTHNPLLMLPRHFRFSSRSRCLFLLFL